MNDSYWTMDIADPDELVSFSIDPTVRRRPLVPDLLQQPGRHQDDARRRQREFDPKKRAGPLLQDPELGRGRRIHGLPLLLAVPLRVLVNKVQGFQVYPTGNYHMEDVWLQK